MHRRQDRSLRAGFVLVLCWAALTVGCGPASFLITPVSGSRALEEHVVERESIWAGKKIALVNVEGVISNARSGSLIGGVGDNPVALLKEKLDLAARDDAVKAVVLRINSPGGGVTASDLMYSELLRFRERTGKPLIASMQDTAASGGYYIACAADRIIASPTTVTGSIGVIMITPELSGLMERIGARANVIKSGPLKDAGSPFREMNEQDRAVFQGIINQMYARFLEVVGRSRKGLSAERIRELADGRVYMAPQALEAGLIDEIGALRESLAVAKRAANLNDTPIMVVEYARSADYRANIYAEAPNPTSQVNLINVNVPWLTRDSGPQFMYLWAPGL